MSFLDEINQDLFWLYNNPFSVLVQFGGNLLISVFTKRIRNIVKHRVSCCYVAINLCVHQTYPEYCKASRFLLLCSY